MTYEVFRNALISTFIVGSIFSINFLGIIVKIIISFLLTWLILSYIKSYEYDPIELAIETMARGIARWKLAADQDTNPFIRNLHANYAAAYSFALRDIASDYTIKSVVGISGLALQNSAMYAQDQALRTLASICPKGQPNDFLLGVLAGEAGKKIK